MIKIYCDGACSDNGYATAVGGFGVAVFNTDISTESPIFSTKGKLESATNNIAELVGAIEACKAGELMVSDEDPINIYLDSAYIHNCYEQKWYVRWKNNGWRTAKHTPVLNKQLWETLIPYFEDSRFNFYKVKGHEGEIGNEYADKLAVEARTYLINYFTAPYLEKKK